MHGELAEQRFQQLCQCCTTSGMDTGIPDFGYESDILRSRFGIPKTLGSGFGIPETLGSVFGIPETIGSEPGIPEVIRSELGIPEPIQSKLGIPGPTRAKFDRSFGGDQRRSGVVAGDYEDSRRHPYDLCFFKVNLCRILHVRVV